MRNHLIFIAIMIASTPVIGKSLELVSLEYPPYIFQEKGKVKGIAVDLVLEALKRSGHSATIKIHPWVRSLKQVESGSADAIFTIYKNPDREKFADFSNEVLIPQTVSFFSKKDSNFKYNGNLESVSKYKIGVVRGVSYGKIFDDAVKSGQLKSIDESNNANANFKKLLKGRFDLLVSNKYGALFISKKTNSSNLIKEISPPLQTVPSYIAFSKKRGLSHIRDEFDSALRSMKSDGKYKEIIDSYTK
ncbi:substrate-binding periplasmic protein [Dongshaea marina]|uniref:substrate-binding periplasmic protein n=1 Tax=Dongshaea marina TaxID=2047966 RepID=UPI000D3EBEBC|nr:transporter substrate-binding domain-containing protein [Dongshaea marina]